jgi:chemotaxis protein methyltransferase CheR
MRDFTYTAADFEILRALSNQHSGILVPDDKFDMFYSRVSKRVRFLGFSDFKKYCQYIQTEPAEFTEFINAITTNLTAFFRESHHFDYIRNTIIPDLLSKNAPNRQVKVWSAGCSTGEEPYSIAMTLKAHLPADWEIKILATDLDTNVLTAARNGIYSHDRLEGIQEDYLKRWFQKGTASQSDKVRIKPELRQLVHFKHLNLMNEWPMKGYFDFIFCRNVLIYFDKETKTKLSNKYAQLLKEGAYLFIGHSESLHQLESGFNLIGNTIYKKK